MINAFRVAGSHCKISIFLIAFLCLALSSSCAQKKSAIEQLIVHKPSDETKREVEEKKIRQWEVKKTVEVTEKAKRDVSKIKVEKDVSQEKKPQEESRVAALTEEKIKGQKIDKALDSISRAISNLTEQSNKIRKDRQVESHVKEEPLPDAPKHMTKASKTLSLSQKKLHKIPQPPVPKKIRHEKEVSLNFESTDIKDIIITFCDLLKIDYILDPGISGKITLQTFKKAKVKDLFQILEKILILNNLTVVKTGNFYRFMPVAAAKKESLNIFFGKDSDLIPSRDRLIIQIIPLKHISISSVKGIIAPLLSQHASFLDVPETNNLMIIDTATNIKRLLDIIEIIDVEAAESLQVKLFPLKHSDATEFAVDIKEIFNALGYATEGPTGVAPKATPRAKRKVPSKPKPVTSPRAKPLSGARSKASSKKQPTDSSSVINFVPIEKLNSLLLVNPFPELLPNIEFWISKLDRPFKLFIGNDSTLIPDKNEQILQIVPLDFVTPDSIQGIITPILTKQGSLSTAPDNNSLIIVDFDNNIKWILEIINALDINSLDKIQVKLFQIEFTFADEMAYTLEEIFGSLGYTARDTGSGLKFIPIERLNSLIVINSIPEILPNIEFWISKLDKPGLEGLEEKTFIYYVQNAKAGDLAGLLTQLYPPETLTGSDEERDRRFRKSKKEPRKTTGEKKEKKMKGKAKPKPAKSSVKVRTLQTEEVTGEILFISDEFTNAIIIKTLPRNYPAILETIKYLDLMPLQVMIEVLVLELALDDITRAGIDWAFKKGDLALGSAAQSITVGAALGESATAALSQGASLIVQSKNVAALFQAFAQDSKLNVLSNPILITSENKSASISITNDIPVESATITTPTAGQPLTQATVQYKSVGIILNITPQINKDRFVTLEISQESSSVNQAAAFTQPSFFTRSTNTNVVVKDKQTLIIGGLMETRKSFSNVGVPILKDIPILGRLFKSKSRVMNKSELIIFITPYVIENIAEANEATKNFRSKLLNIKKDFRLEKQIN